MEVKIGIVGYGSIGQRHENNLRKLGHQVVIYDPAYGGSDVRRETGIYDDKNIEAVLVCTPSPFHEGPLRACIERGKHVFIEKPISTSIGMLPQLLEAADSKNLVVMVGTNLRFHPAIERAKRWIDEGLIGRPLWASFICAQENTKYRDSVILNWGAHEVDVAIHLLGPVDAVLAATVDRRSAEDNDLGIGSPINECVADFVLRHKSGARSSFHLDYITPREIREAWIAGNAKNIGIDLVSRRASFGSFVEQLEGSFDSDYVDEMAAFVARIQNGVTPGATGWQGLAVLQTLLDVRKKAGLM